MDRGVGRDAAQIATSTNGPAATLPAPILRGFSNVEGHVIISEKDELRG